MDVWFYPRIETAAERPTPRAEKGKELHRRSSRAHQEGFLPLRQGPIIDVGKSERFLPVLQVSDFRVNQALKRITRLVLLASKSRIAAGRLH